MCQHFVSSYCWIFHFTDVYILFNHPSVDRHLDCFHSLAINHKLLWTSMYQCMFSVLLSSNFRWTIQFRCLVMSSSLQLHESQNARPRCPSPTPGIHPNPCPSSQWCHPAIKSSVVPFSSCPQSLPASESFPVSQLFSSGGQSIGALASVLPMNIHDWFPLGWTGLISLLSKGLSTVFSSTTVQKHEFFGAQPSLWSSFHAHIWLLEKP